MGGSRGVARGGAGGDHRRQVGEDDVGDAERGLFARIVATPHEADPAHRPGRGERPALHQSARYRADPRLRGERRQQGTADAGGDHLTQGFQAGGLELVAAGGACAAAQGQRVAAQAVPFFQQQVLGVQVFGADAGLANQRAVLRQGDDEGLVEQLQDFEIAVGDRQGEQRGVEPALAQALEQVRGEILAQEQTQLRRAPAQGGQQVRDEIGAQGRNHPEAQRAVERIAVLAGEVADLLDHGEGGARALDDLLADRRRDQVVLVALEQGDPEIVLELAQLRAQCRLADVAGLCRAHRVAGVGECDEVAQLLQRHGRPPA